VGLVFNTGLIMIMIHGNALIRRGSEIIDRVVEIGLNNYWISFIVNHHKLIWKTAIFHPLDGYYSFSRYHMQPAF